jgi:hypothetical protein
MATVRMGSNQDRRLALEVIDGEQSNIHYGGKFRYW